MFKRPRQGLSARQVETMDKLFAAGAEELRSVGHEMLTIRTVAARAGVSPATAYTYLASKNHLFAELFLDYLLAHPDDSGSTGKRVVRVQRVTRRMADLLAAAPELAAAVTPALLGTDPDVDRLRVKIGAELLGRFRGALGQRADDDVLDALLLAFSGALLQAGMGLMAYTEMGDRLDGVVATILKGH